MATKDIKIQNVCDHTIYEEILTLKPDRLTLYPQFPVASKSFAVLSRFGEPLAKESYSYVQDKQLLYENKYFKIVLTEPELYLSPIYTLTYSTFPQFCPKCLETGFVDDLVEVSPGDVKIVSGAYLLIQQVEKTIVTSLGTNKYYPWAGCGLSGLVGSKITDFQILKMEIVSKVQTALNNLRTIQQKHQAVNPSVSPDEVLKTVETIEVTQDSSDQTIINLFVQYTSQSGNPYDHTQILELTNYRAR